MTAALAHRGLDDSGIHAVSDGGPALGQRRLRILDLAFEACSLSRCATGLHGSIFRSDT